MKSYSIVCFGCIWDDFWRRRQQIMHYLAKRDEIKKVIYIEFPLTLTSLVKYYLGSVDDDGRRRWRRFFKHGSIYSLDNVMVIFPLAIFPYFSLKVIQRINEFITYLFLFRRIKSIITKQKLENIITWIDHPNYSSSYFGRLKEKMFCYDTADEHWRHNEAHLKGRVKRLVQNDMDNTLKANVVFVNSEKLFNEKKRINASTYLLTNGVDFDLFQEKLKDNVSVPYDIRSIKKPIIGAIVGLLDEKHDLELLVKIMTDKPQWSLVIIGPKSVNPQGKIVQLRSMENVHFLGPKPYDQLPSYIRHFDVCANFYKTIDINDTCTSIKLLNYMAVGKPIVSTNAGGVNIFSEVIDIADDAQSYISLVQKSITGRASVKAERGRYIAEQNSWRHKAQYAWEILSSNLAR
jgi:glycosyltransferase involved in cell wall biosynthesis